MPFSRGSAGKVEIDLALRCVTAIDVYEIGKYRLPPLYQSGVRWRRERCLAIGVPETCERFLSARQAYKERFGDCDDLAPWRAAEIQLQGVPCFAEVIPSPGIGWHAIVRLPDGSIEDPSALLGMNAKRARR